MSVPSVSTIKIAMERVLASWRARMSWIGLGAGMGNASGPDHGVQTSAASVWHRTEGAVSTPAYRQAPGARLRCPDTPKHPSKGQQMTTLKRLSAILAA